MGIKKIYGSVFAIALVFGAADAWAGNYAVGKSACSGTGCKSSVTIIQGGGSVAHHYSTSSCQASPDHSSACCPNPVAANTYCARMKPGIYSPTYLSSGACPGGYTVLVQCQLQDSSSATGADTQANPPSSLAGKKDSSTPDTSKDQANAPDGSATASKTDGAQGSQDLVANIPPAAPPAAGDSGTQTSSTQGRPGDLTQGTVSPATSSSSTDQPVNLDSTPLTTVQGPSVQSVADSLPTLSDPNAPASASAQAQLGTSPQSKTASLQKGADNTGGGVNDPGSSPTSPTADDIHEKITKSPDEDCSNSGNFDPQFQANCGHTNSLIKTSQITTVVGQVGGSIAVNVMGAQQQQQMMTNGTSQSDAMKNAAKLQNTAGMLQTALGAGQLVMGFMEDSAAKKHSNAATQLNKVSTEVRLQCGTPGYVPDPKGICGPPAPGPMGAAAAATAGSAGPRYAVGLNGQSDAGKLADYAINNGTSGTEIQHMDTLSHAQSQLGEDSQAARKEQILARGKAQDQSTQDYVKGASTLASGLMAMMAAKQEAKLADTMANAPTGVTIPGADPFNPTAVGGGPAPVTNTGMQAATAPQASSSPAAAPGAMFGTPPGDLGGGGMANPGPAPNPYVAGTNGGAAGQGIGGGGLGGSTGTSADAAAKSEDPQPKLAANANNMAYEGVGAPGGGGGGSRGPAGAGDSTLSLKDALAALLGNQEGKKDEPGTDIMNYRKVASDEPMLGKSDNIFTYIHGAYEGLNKKGRIGM